MKNIKAIIFDMDGTILDTEHIWQHATRTIIESRGIKYTAELHEELSIHLGGAALAHSCSSIKKVTNIQDSLESLVKEKEAIANDIYAKEVRFILGFEEFFKEVLIHNLKTAIATNATPSTVEITDDVLNLKRFFNEHIYNISHVNYKGKPNPDIFLYAADKLKINPKDCLVIEDSSHGIEAAKSAGMTCIGINTAKNREKLKKADLIVEGYHEIPLKKLINK